MKTVLITGGSSGIGLELAKCFGQDGYHLLLVSKPMGELLDAQSKLRALFPDIEVDILQKDLTEKDAPNEVYEFCRSNQITVDVLVNNAGFGSYGFIPDIPMEREINMLELNIMTVYKLTRLFLDDMLKRDEGKILNISSISAFQPSPYFTTYAASKSFILNFSRGLNYELKEQGSKVRTTAVCPTSVRSGFQKASKMERSKVFDSWMAVEASRVAKDAYKALINGQDMVVPKIQFHWLNKISRRLPSKLAMKIAANEINKK